MKEIEVRCCCDASKILGWVCLQDGLVRHGQKINFVVSDPENEPHFLPEGFNHTYRTLNTELSKFWDENLVEGIAVKSNNHPFSLWKKVHGFKPNPDFTGEET